jgi:hypothetical protein
LAKATLQLAARKEDVEKGPGSPNTQPKNNPFPLILNTLLVDVGNQTVMKPHIEVRSFLQFRARPEGHLELMFFSRDFIFHVHVTASRGMARQKPVQSKRHGYLERLV